MRSPAKRIAAALLTALAMVIVLSAFALAPALHFFSYPLVPGIALAGAIFTNVESDHTLRMTIGSIVFNTLLYGVVFYFFFAPRARRRSRAESR